MKLRVRINRQTSRVELPGQEPSLKELKDHIQETVLSSHGLRSDWIQILNHETCFFFLLSVCLVLFDQNIQFVKIYDKEKQHLTGSVVGVGTSAPNSIYIYMFSAKVMQDATGSSGFCENSEGDIRFVITCGQKHTKHLPRWSGLYLSIQFFHQIVVKFIHTFWSHPAYLVRSVCKIEKRCPSQ